MYDSPVVLGTTSSSITPSALHLLGRKSVGTSATEGLPVREHDAPSHTGPLQLSTVSVLTVHRSMHVWLDPSLSISCAFGAFSMVH